MARVKKPDAPPPPPKHPRECKHGCTDCKYYRLDVKAFPCRDCERWNYWEDAHPEKNNTVPFPLVSIPNTSTQEPALSLDEPKKRGRYTPIADPQPSTPRVAPEQTPAMPKKRGRKPKADVIVSEDIGNESAQTNAEPAKHVRKSSKKEAETTELPPSAKEQLSLFS